MVDCGRVMPGEDVLLIAILIQLQGAFMLIAVIY